MTIETDVQGLTDATTDLLVAVNVSKATLDAKVANASASAASATASATAANTSAGNASGFAASALAVYGTTNAQQAALMAAQSAASLAQGYALSASSAIQQDLSGVTAQALHRSPNAVTAMFVYDTSKDSDGGAWTEKCQHTSWYNEALNGKWLGAHVNELNARSVGATLGPDKITNGSFSTASGFGITAGAINTSTGRFEFNGVATGNLFYQDGPANSYVATSLYLVEFDYSSNVPLSSYIGGGSIQTASSGTGRFRGVVQGTAGIRLQINVGGTSATGWIDNLSVREVTALTTASGDYYQSTVDGKFYRLWKNLLKQSNTFTDTAWTKTNVLPTVVSTVIDGVNATQIAKVADGSSWLGGAVATSIPIGTPFCISVVAKAGTSSVLTIHENVKYNNIGYFDLSAGTATKTTAQSDAGVSIQPLGNGEYRCIAYGVSNGNVTPFFYGGNGNFGASWATGSTLLIAKSQIEYGTTATAYEVKTVDGSITETFRGNKADFPRLAGIVAEAASVTIYDLTEAGRPMWMRFAPQDTTQSMVGAGGGFGFGSLAASQGLVCIGAPSGAGLGFTIVNYPADNGKQAAIGPYVGTFRGTIAQRNLGLGRFPGGYYIVSGFVNAIAMTVLPDAPVDAVTGLQVPTIAVATAGGLSFIKHNGTVVNITNTFYVSFAEVAFEKNGSILARQFSGSPFFPIIIRYFKVPEASYSVTATSIGVNGYVVAAASALPMRLASSGGNYRVTPNTVSYNDTVYRYKGNISEGGKSALVTITNTFNTGHMLSDIRRAYLADVDVGSVSGTELVTNGTFDTDISGWSVQVGTLGQWSVVNGKLTLTTGGDAALWQGVPTVIGKTYQIKVTTFNTGSTQVRFINSNNVNGTIVSSVNVPATGEFVYTFTAITTFAIFQLRAGTAGATFDDVSVRECSADRSYKAQGASITGTLTKTQVAAASQLVAYSGFSAANYLREPYSADLDFGTGEWSASAWVNVPVTLPVGSFPVTGSELVTNGAFDTDTTGWTSSGNGTQTISVTGGQLVISSIVGGWNFVSTQITTVAGKTYVFTIDLISATGGTGTGGSVQVGTNVGNAGSLTQTTLATTGTKRAVSFTANGSTTFVWFATNSAVSTNVVLDNASVKEVTPSMLADRAHSSGSKINIGLTPFGFLTATAFDGTTTRTVTTTAAYNTATWLKARAFYTTDGTLGITVNGVEVAVTRGAPLLGLDSRYNLLAKTEDLTDATVWAKTSGGTGSLPVVTAAQLDPLGGTTAFRVRSNRGAGNTSSDFSILRCSTSAISNPRRSVWVKSNTGASQVTRLSIGVSSTQITVTTVWQEITQDSTDTTARFDFASYGPDGTTNDLDILVWHPDLRRSEFAARPYQRVNTATDFDFAAPLTIGNSFAADAPFPGSIALLKFSATVPTAEQAQWMYEQEKQMFRDGAQVCLPDSGAIVDLTYDDATDKWIAVSATNESEWSGLVRTSVTASPAGSYTKTVAASGIQMHARSTTNPGVDINIPAYGLREELVNRSQAAARLARNMVAFDYVGGFTANTTTGSTAIASVASLTYPVSYVGARISGAGIPANTTVVAVSGTTIYMSAAATATASGVQISFVDFALPVGYEAKNVLSAGATKVEGATKDFTRLFDGFKETIRFGTAPGFNVAVQIQATRSVQ